MEVLSVWNDIMTDYFLGELSLKMNFVYTELLVIPTNPSDIHCTSRNSHEFGGSVFLILLLLFICHLIFTWHFLKLAWFCSLTL